MNKRKLLTLALTLCMIAILAIGGTLAYFTDTEQKTNTMTIGNVKINIEELAYIDSDGDGDKEWVDFRNDDFTLYPIDDEQGMDLNNKIVYTFNTSESEDDAYIRTIVAIEDFDWAAADLSADFKGLHWSYPTKDSDSGVYHGAKVAQTIENIMIDGKQYDVVVFEENDGEAIGHDECLATLNSVWLDKAVTQTQAAGWNGAIDIKVFSQAIQATGLTHTQAMNELGAITSENLSTWFGADDAIINDIFNYPASDDLTTDAPETGA